MKCSVACKWILLSGIFCAAPLRAETTTSLQLLGSVGGAYGTVESTEGLALNGKGLQLQIHDTSIPTDPVLLSEILMPSRIGDICISGTRAYVATQKQVHIVDLAVPTAPVVSGTYSAAGFISEVDIKGNLLFAAAGQEGLHIVDVTQPTSPTLLADMNTSDSVAGVTVRDGLAFISRVFYGVQIVDVSDPASPVEIGEYNTPGFTRAVQLSGNRAYVANGFSGIVTLDITDPTSPTLVTTNSGFGGKARIAGNHLFVAAHNSGLAIYDISDPQTLTHVGGYDTEGQAADLAIVNGYAYVTDYNRGLHIINVSNPAAPVRTRLIETISWPTDVFMTGPLACVSDHQAGLRMVDISEMASPTLRGLVPTSSYAMGASPAEHYALLADGRHGVKVVDTSNPDSPVVVGSCDTPGTAEEIVVVGNLAYVADYIPALSIVDLTNPQNPVVIGSCNAPGYSFDLDVEGNHAYVTGSSEGLQVFDISNPYSPQRIGGLFFGGAHSIEIEVTGHYAYLSTGGTGNQDFLRVLDVSNPALPTPVDTLPMRASEIEIAGNSAFVARGPEGLSLLDISDPDNITVASTLSLPGSVNGLSRAGGVAFPVGDFGLAVVASPADLSISLSSPAPPVLLNKITSVTVELDVKDLGGAGLVTAVGELPGSVDYVSGVVTEGAVSFADQKILLELNQLLPGRPVEAIIQLRPTAAGAVSIPWSVSSPQPDPVMEDNVTTIQLLVEDRPIMAVEPTSVDFGGVEVGSSAELDVAIRNVGVMPLNITELQVQASAAFAISGDLQLPISVEPESSYKVRISYSPADDGGSTGTLRITSNDPSAAIYELPLSGFGYYEHCADQWPLVAEAMDLRSVVLSERRTTTKKGQKLKLKGLVELQQAHSLPRRAHVAVSIYRSSSSNPCDPAATLIGTQSSKLKRKGQNKWSFTGIVSPPLQPGEYLIFVLDPSNQYQEPDERNNYLVHGPLP